MKIIVVLCLFLVTAILFGACGRSEEVIRRISIRADAFSPKEIKVKIGTTVIWTNIDKKSSHRIKSITFGSSDLIYGDTYTHVFNIGGVYEYECGVDPTLTGKIIVE